MASNLLSGLIPDSNRAELAFANRVAAVGLLESLYGEASGFVGCFLDEDGQPTWARRAARWLRDEFREVTNNAKFGNFVAELPQKVGDGRTHINCRHALELWHAGGQKGVEPFTNQQDYGSCVDASGAELETGILGWRAAHPSDLAGWNEPIEEYRDPAAWYDYANRGYCSDGWNGYGRATVARKVGIAFRKAYAIGSNSVDFTDDDANERLVARTWCRSGIPAWLRDYTAANHAYTSADAMTEFSESGGLGALLTLFANGGQIHTSGTRTSGGSKPFTIGSVGPHMQTGAGGDDSDEFRRFCKDVIGVTARTNDYPVVMHQTWGNGWRGECADQYWPFGTDSAGKVWTMADVKAKSPSVATVAELLRGWGWGYKPQGAWVWWASDVLGRLSCDIAYLPRCKGCPSANPLPPPVQKAPQLVGLLRAEPLPMGIAVRGEVSLTQGERTWYYIAVPAGDNRYQLEEKPQL